MMPVGSGTARSALDLVGDEPARTLVLVNGGGRSHDMHDHTFIVVESPR
jgi:hypothetical protein